MHTYNFLTNQSQTTLRASYSLRRTRPYQLPIHSNKTLPRMSVFARGLGILAIATGCQLSHAASVFINELHYDNAGSDMGEGIEIAAASGTNLDDWQLFFYNGSDGGIYKTELLSGTIENQSAGYGVLSFDFSGLQNGPADAVALVNPLGNVLEFLSYEGTVTATEGAANGLQSIDIGLEESNSSPVGLSLQRVGSGLNSGALSWLQQGASFGSINDGQHFTNGNAVPLPAAAWLFGASLAGLGLGRNFRQ